MSTTFGYIVIVIRNVAILLTPKACDDMCMSSCILYDCTGGVYGLAFTVEGHRDKYLAVTAIAKCLSRSKARGEVVMSENHDGIPQPYERVGLSNVIILLEPNMIKSRI